MCKTPRLPGPYGCWIRRWILRYLRAGTTNAGCEYPALTTCVNCQMPACVCAGELAWPGLACHRWAVYEGFDVWKYTRRLLDRSSCWTCPCFSGSVLCRALDMDEVALCFWPSCLTDVSLHCCLAVSSARGFFLIGGQSPDVWRCRGGMVSSGWIACRRRCVYGGRWICVWISSVITPPYIKTWDKSSMTPARAFPLHLTVLVRPEVL